jgi:hypothetical protein
MAKRRMEGKTLSLLTAKRRIDTARRRIEGKELSLLTARRRSLTARRRMEGKTLSLLTAKPRIDTASRGMEGKELSLFTARRRSLPTRRRIQGKTLSLLPASAGSIRRGVGWRERGFPCLPRADRRQGLGRRSSGNVSKVPKRSTPLRQVAVSGTGVRTAEALITPALFSQPPPRRPGEEGEQPRAIPPW